MADVERTHFSEEELVWFFYGEAENSAEIDLHLTLCPQCRRDYEALKAEMATIGTWSPVEAEPDYGQQVWRELVRKDASIARGKRFVWRAWLLPRRLAAAGAVAALLITAFLAGRVSHRLDEPVSPAVAAIARERILAAALTEHLEQSERTLIEITNSGGPEIDIRDEQRRAQSLLAGNRLYRQAAAREGHTALASVLEDLERVLLDIAHAPAEMPQEDVTRLRARVEDQQLLFRLRVLGLRLQELQDEPIRPQSQRNQKG
jgi:signal transduction histidine kinase